MMALDGVSAQQQASYHGRKMDKIRTMHRSIQDTINEIQGKTTRILQDQERDLLRSFRRRLADVTAELQKEKRKNESGSAQWVLKCRKLTEELDWLRNHNEQTQEENKTLTREAKKLRKQLQTQEEDRQFLIKQLVAVKKENARLRQAYDRAKEQQQQQQQQAVAVRAESARPGSAASSARGSSSGRNSRPQTSGPRGREVATPSPVAEQRYRNIVARLKRALESEQAQNRKLQVQLNQYTADTNELQAFFKRCVEDARAMIAERRGVPPPELADVASHDRIRIVHNLLAQDHVIRLLHDAMFPKRSGRAAPTLEEHLAARVTTSSSPLGSKKR